MVNIAKEIEKLAEDFGVDRKRSIGEVAQKIGVEPHVIRFWEDQFSQIKPEIGKGGRRYYYNKQFEILKKIKKFLHEDGYTIAGLQKLLKKRKEDSHKGEDVDIILAVDLEDAKNHDDFMVESNQENADVANISIVNFIDPEIDLSSSKSLKIELARSEREELSALIRNITKNLGDLKMLLRS